MLQIGRATFAAVNEEKPFSFNGEDGGLRSRGWKFESSGGHHGALAEMAYARGTETSVQTESKGCLHRLPRCSLMKERLNPENEV